MDLLAAQGVIEAALQAGAKVGHHRKRGLLLRAGRAGRAVSPELVDLALEGNQLAVEPVEGPEAKVTVAQQVGHGGLPLVNPCQQGAHQGTLVDLAAPLASLPASKLLADLDGAVT